MKKHKNSLNFYNDFIPQASLDYHNLGILNSYEIEKILMDFFLDCEFMGYKRVLVITGKGKVVKPSVFKLLKQSKKVKEFKTAGYFNGQEGAFEVILL